MIIRETQDVPGGHTESPPEVDPGSGSTGEETELTGGGTVLRVRETVQEEALGDTSGEREVLATFFRPSAWTTSEMEVLGSKTLNLLPCSVAVTR